MNAIIELIIKLFDNYPRALLITGAIFIVIGIAEGVTYHNLFPIHGNVERIAAVIFGAFLVVLSAFFSALSVYKASTSSPALPNASKYGIKIRHPESSDVVEQTVTVLGTIERQLPPGYALVILKTYAGDGFVPMKLLSASDIKGDNWKATGCKLGGKPQEARWIDAYLVGPEGQVLIKFFFSMAHYFEQKFSNEEWTYFKIPEMTSDMIKCDHITVVIK